MPYPLVARRVRGVYLCVMRKRINVLCVDDHQIVREGIVSVIGRQSDMRVTGIAANGLQAVEAFLQNPPDVTLMDLQMPVLSGLDAIRRIRAADAQAKIIVLTTYHGDENIHQALAAGAATYLLKESVLDDLAGVVRAVHNGAKPLSDDVQRDPGESRRPCAIHRARGRGARADRAGAPQPGDRQAWASRKRRSRCTSATSWTSCRCRTGRKP